jgi:hypothetical protein
LAKSPCIKFIEIRGSYGNIVLIGRSFSEKIIWLKRHFYIGEGGIAEKSSYRDNANFAYA